MTRKNSADWLTYAATITVVLLGLFLLAAQTGVGNYALDDAYIVEHSVNGILAGHESRFIRSTPWEGVTSPAYVGSVALLSLLVPVELSHWVISTLSTLLLASGWYLLCRRHSLGSPLTIAVVVVSLLVGMTYYQLTNGLETGMAIAAFTWTLIALDFDRPPDWGYALAGIQCLIRPELSALSAIFAIYIIAKRPAGWLMGLLITLFFFVIPILLLFFVSGALLPNTLSAKTYFFAEGCRPDPFKFAFVLSAFGTFVSSIGLFAAGFAMAIISRQRLVLFSFAALFLFAYFEKFPGALFHNHSRYLYLLLPIAVSGWIACLGHKDRILRLCSAALGAIVAFSVLYSSGSSFRLYVDEVRRTSEDNFQMTQWVARHVPQQAIILVHDAGRISTVGEQPLVDLVGLKSSYSVEVHRRTTFEECRRVPEAISEIARHAEASYMVVTSDWDRIFGLTESLRRTGWSVERADSDRGDSIYKVYRILDHTPKSTDLLKAFR